MMKVCTFKLLNPNTTMSMPEVDDYDTEEDELGHGLTDETIMSICFRHDPIKSGYLNEEQFIASFGELAGMSTSLSSHSAKHLFSELNQNGKVKYDDT
eukprot:UN02568